MNIVEKNKKYFDSIIDSNRDYLIDYFGFKTLEKSYLIKINNSIIVLNSATVRACGAAYHERQTVSSDYSP